MLPSPSTIFFSVCGGGGGGGGGGKGSQIRKYPKHWNRRNVCCRDVWLTLSQAHNFVLRELVFASTLPLQIVAQGCQLYLCKLLGKTATVHQQIVAQDCHCTSAGCCQRLSLYLYKLLPKFVTVLQQIVAPNCHCTSSNCCPKLSLYLSKLLPKFVTVPLQIVSQICHCTSANCCSNLSLYLCKLLPNIVVLLWQKSAAGEQTVQLQRIIHRCSCKFYYANYGDVDPNSLSEVPLPVRLLFDLKYRV